MIRKTSPFAEVPASELPKSQLEGEGLAVLDLLAGTSLVKSKGDARRSISEGGLSINNVRIQDPLQMVTVSDLLAGQFIVLRKGKKNYHLVRVLS